MLEVSVINNWYCMSMFKIVYVKNILYLRSVICYLMDYVVIFIVMKICLIKILFCLWMLCS